MTTGIYFHIPFCEAKCSYCHFVTRPFNKDLAERYCEAIVREMKLFFATYPCPERVDTIYFGGGTPSLVRAEGIGIILEACRSTLRIDPDSEITLEANPESISAAKVDSYRRMGVNRVSIGAQSFNERQLDMIGRHHSGDQIIDCVALLQARGIDNLNLDLMLGLPGQNEDELRSDLARLCALSPAHISVYMLDLDAQVPLYHALKKGSRQLPDDDLLSDWYLLTLDYLAGRGYEQYEISNFALAGRQSRHNLKYWQRQPVLGFGVSSHSFDGRNRFANHSNLKNYMRSVQETISPIAWRDKVLPLQALEEALFLGLRMNGGVDWNVLRSEYGDSRLAAFESSLREMAGRGLIEWRDSVVRLTPQGMLLSNEIFQAFV